MKNIFIILGLFILSSCAKEDLVNSDYNHNGGHHNDNNRGDDYDRHRDRHGDRDDEGRRWYWPW